MTYSELAYTKPYLMTLRPDREMDVALLGRPEMTRVIVEYGPTPALGRFVEAERFDIRGLRTAAREDGYAPVQSDNPELSVVQFVAHLTNLPKGARVYYRAAFPDTHQRRVSSDIYDFRTAPEAGSPFSFALMSDLQLFKPCDRTVRQIGRHPLDFILYAGDLVSVPWHADDWFDVPEAPHPPRGASMTEMPFFSMMQRQDDGVRLMQFMPFFCCPGNHETDNPDVDSTREQASQTALYSWRIYMQLFRTYYPEQQYLWGGRRWYSLDYAALHVTSLDVVRCNPWNAYEAPGQILRGDIEPGSAQAEWLENDLHTSQAPLKWVIMHWHMMNRGDDTQPPLCRPRPDPDNPNRVVYPVNAALDFLHPLFRDTHVNGVSYGHSHVYERYLIDGVNYIEAAYMGVKYGGPDGQVNPSGILPVNQEHHFRSYMIVSCDGRRLSAQSYQASVEPNGTGYEGRVFDQFDIG